MSRLFISESRRAWLACLLLLGNPNLASAAVETSSGYAALSIQTTNQTQGDKGNDELENKGQESVPNDGTPKPEQDDGADGTPSGENPAEKPQDPSGDEGATSPEATPDAQVEPAGVAAGEAHVLPNPVGRTSSGDGRYFVGEVSVNDGSSLFIGGTRLIGGSRWLSVLRAGMWLEADGHWENDVFVAADVKVLEAEDWAYYRGPAAALAVDARGTVEAWTANGNPAFEGVRSAPDQAKAVRLVAFFDGQGLVAVPPSFPQPPAGAAVGWLELNGYFDGEKVVWESAAPFP